MRDKNKLGSIHTFWLPFLLSVFILMWPALGRAATLTIQIDNPPPSGTVVFMLFESANTFGGLRNPAKSVKFKLDGRDVYQIEQVATGEYALLVYFDENNNDKIDKNFIGIPIEPLGFSNNYQPKGPPSYSRAAFSLQEQDVRHFDVTLSRPLGEFGRLGVGLGVIGRSSPYRDYNGSIYQPIPAITYIGSRLQIFGPHIQYGFLGRNKLRLAITGQYRIGAYNEDDSAFLAGMGDRKSLFMPGLALQVELPAGVGFSADYAHSLFGRIGGGAARLKLSKAFHSGAFRLSPSIAVNWLSSKLSNHDFGVPPNRATPERPAYALDDTLSIEGGLGLSIEVTQNWLGTVNTNVELLGHQITDSPIVSKDYVIKGFAAIIYQF